MTEEEKEMFLILKYGSMDDAMLFWWGKVPSDDDQWEVYALQAWQEREHDKRRALQESRRADEEAARQGQVVHPRFFNS